MLIIPVTLVTGLLIGGSDPAAVKTTLAFAIACAAGGAAYAAVFVALSSLTARALIAGLIYVLLWEGALGGLLEGTRFLSIRQATLGIVAGLGGGGERDAAADRRLRGGHHRRHRRVARDHELAPRPFRGPRRRLTLDRSRPGPVRFRDKPP